MTANGWAQAASPTCIASRGMLMRVQCEQVEARPLPQRSNARKVITWRGRAVATRQVEGMGKMRWVLRKKSTCVLWQDAPMTMGPGILSRLLRLPSKRCSLVLLRLPLPVKMCGRIMRMCCAKPKRAVRVRCRLLLKRTLPRKSVAGAS